MTLKKIKLSDIDFIKTYHYPKGATANQVIKDSSCDILINGILFDNKTKTALTRIKVDGFKYGSYFSKFGIGIRSNKELFWGNIFDYIEDKDIKHFICSAPTLVIDGKINMDKEGLKKDFLNQIRNRTAIGFNDNEFVLYTSDDHISFNRLANDMVSFGCKYALSTDGGGSSCLIYKGKVVNGRYDGRKITHWVGVKLKDKKEENKDEENMNKQYKICLDLGHNAKFNSTVDCGAVGKVLGLKEADVVLKLGRLLEKELTRHNVKIYKTRDSEARNAISQGADLTARCKYANDLKVDYLVSLHCNSATNTSAQGIETWIYGKGGNAEKLAHSVQLQMDKDLKRPSRGVKVGNLAMIRETKMPAILIELGFISNIEEEKLLSSDDFTNKSATSIAKGILNHLNIEWIEETKPEPPKESDDMDKKYPADLSDWAKTAYDFVTENGISDGANPKLNVTAERLWGMLYKYDQYLKSQK